MPILESVRYNVPYEQHPVTMDSLYNTKNQMGSTTILSSVTESPRTQTNTGDGGRLQDVQHPCDSDSAVSDMVSQRDLMHPKVKDNEDIPVPRYHNQGE